MKSNPSEWLFCLVLLAAGIANLALVHPVPGLAYMLVSLVYFPPANAALKNRFGLAIPLAAKIIVGIAVVWFTLGASDLGDMID